MPEMNMDQATDTAAEDIEPTSGLDMDEKHQVDMFQKAIGILKEFKTADEIAEYLQSQGIKATPGSSASCAISEYIKGVVNL